MAAEADPSLATALAGVLRAERARQRGDVGIADHRAVELDGDARARHGHFLEVPLADAPQVAAVARRDAVDGPVVLPRLELRVLRGGVVEHLHLEPGVRGV